MLNLIKKATIGASLVTGISTLASIPALAASIAPTSLTGNYLVYDVNGTNTVNTPYTGLSQISTILDGSINAPTGNVELFANSETSTYTNMFTGLTNFKNAPVTTLTGTILNTPIIISSLNGNDWFTTTAQTYSTAYGANNLATKWFNAALQANGFGTVLNTPLASLAYTAFLGGGGFARFSDPNIAYVTQANANSNIKIGLAGHLDARTVLAASFSAVQNQLAALGLSSPSYNDAMAQLEAVRSPSQQGSAIQASEVVKVIYGGQTHYKYSFNGVASGLTAIDDGISHNATYEVEVPEPITTLGLMAGLGSAIAIRRRQKKAN